MYHFIKDTDVSPQNIRRNFRRGWFGIRIWDNVESADDNDDEDEQSSSDLEDNTAYQDWLVEAKETTGDLWNIKYDKYTSEGMSEDQATEKANMKRQWAVKRNFLPDSNTFNELFTFERWRSISRHCLGPRGETRKRHGHK